MPKPIPHPAGKARAKAHRRISWWRRVVYGVLNLALLAVLGLQLFVLVILSTHRHLTLPGFVQEAVEQRLEDQGLSLRFRQLDVTLTGRILIYDPKIFLTGSVQPVIEAEYLQVDPDWIGLLWSGRLRFSQLRLAKGAVYCPPEVSATGVREPILRDVRVSLNSQGGRWWQLEHLRARVFNVALTAGGMFQLPPLPEEAPPEVSLAARYRAWTRAATRLLPYFNAVQQSSLNLALDTVVPGVVRARVQADAQSVRWPDAGTSVGGVHAEVSATWNGERLHLLGLVDARADSVVFTIPAAAGNQQVEAFSGGPVWLRAGFAEGAHGVLDGKIAQVSLLCGPASLGGFPCGSVAVTTDARAWPALPVSIFATQGPDWLRLRGRADNFTLGSEVNFQLSASLADLLAEAKVQLPERLQSLKFDRALSLGGRLALDAQQRPVSLDFVVDTGGAHFDLINVYALHARGRLGFAAGGGSDAFLASLDLQSATLWNETWQVEGAYFQNFANQDFRLYARGNVDPRVLDPYIGHWWPGVWEFITLGKEWPHADIEYSGNWDAPAPDNPVFGSVSVAGARARGVPMEMISLRIFQRHDVVTVFDLEGRAASGGKLTGALYWLMKPPYLHTYEERLILDSTLPLLEAAMLAGPETVALIQPVDSPTAPMVHVDQRVGGSVNPQPHVMATHLTAKVPAPLHAFHVPLDSLDAEASIYRGFTDIPRFDFGIAGGQARANATLTHRAPGENELAFRVTVQGTHHSAFIHALGQFGAGNETAANVTANATASAPSSVSLIGDPTHKGLLDLALGGQLVLGQPDSFVGGGRAHVYDADLGQIHLFGGLTRVLAGAGVAFGSFDLDRADGDLQIAHQYLRVPNLVITGPSARILAAGLFHFGDNRVNFNALIFPLGEITMPGLAQIARILQPLSNTVTLTLTGTANEPDWSAGVHLLRIFESQTVTGPPIPGYPAKADNSPQTPPFPTPPPLPAAPASPAANP